MLTTWTWRRKAAIVALACALLTISTAAIAYPDSPVNASVTSFLRQEVSLPAPYAAPPRASAPKLAKSDLITAAYTPLAPESVLLSWNTFGNAGTETTESSTSNDPGVESANLTLGAGVSPAGNANRFGGNAWFDTGDTNPTTLAESVAGNDYIQFVVTPSAGYSFTPTSLVFSWDRSGTGPDSVALRSSADSYTTTLGSVTGMAASITAGNTITITGLTNLASATTFRLYGYGATNSGGSGGFDTSTNANNVVLNGTTAALPPAITSISPSSGTTFGGTTVTITGTGLGGATGVSFGGTAATGLTNNTATSIQVTSPAHAAGTVHVTVTTPSGTSPLVAGDQFTYIQPAPTVTTSAATSITTTSAQLNGLANPNGATTTAYFRYDTASPAGGCNDTFGTKTADQNLGAGTFNVGFNEALSSLSPFTTYYFCAIASNSAGPTFGAVQQFTTDPATPTTPVITGSLPTSPNNSSTTPTISGTSSLGSTTINLYTTAGCTGSPIASGSGTTGTWSISNVPVGTNTTTDIFASATNVTGTSGCSSPFSYTHDATAPLAPVISGSNPATPDASTSPNILGTAEDGSTVHIYVGATCDTLKASGPATGGNFDIPISGLVANTPNIITANATDAAGNTGACSNVFTYNAYAIPTVTSVSPNSGPSAGGTSVTITGTNFSITPGETSVDFGGAAGTGVTVNSATSITVTSPAHAAGIVDVTVTTPGGTSATSAGDQFTFEPPSDPSGVGAAIPNTVSQGNTTLLTVTVTPGANPTSTGLAVSGDLTQIGGSATQTFYDDGSHGDATAGDDIFSYFATVPNAATTGTFSLPFTITDDQVRQGTGTIDLTVNAPSCAMLPPSLVAAYRLDVDGADVSGNGLNLGPTGGASFATGKSGQALVLDGTGFEKINDPGTSPFDFTDTLSVDAWVNIPAYSPVGMAVVSKYRASGGPTDGWRAWEMDINPVGQVQLRTSQGDLLSVHSVPLDTWTHIAATFSSTGISTVYLNGQPESSIAFGGAITPSNEALTIGGNGSGEWGRLTGSIDEVHIFSSQLTDNDIAAIYNASFFGTCHLPPAVTSSAATSVTSTSAILNGDLTSTGYDTITERGFYYKQGTGVDSTNGTQVIEGGGTLLGAFSSTLPVLAPNTQYSFIAYATNSSGTTYSSPEETFTTSVPPAPVVTSASPADGATNVSLSTQISVTFDNAMDATTITSTTDATCSGSVQLSRDGFATCVPLGSAVSSAGDTIFTFTPPSPLSSTTVYQIRVTTGAKDSYGTSLASAVTQPSGFTTLNVAPSVASDNASVTVDEGSPAANTGTFSDADTGDDVLISANIGTAIKTGTNSGTWSWSYTPPDGPNDDTITITADDQHGHTTTSTFSLHTNNVAPFEVVTAPATTKVNKDFTLQLGAIGDPGQDWPVSYSIDWGDGNTPSFPGGPEGQTASHQYAAVGTYNYSVSLTDDDGTFQVFASSVTVGKADTTPSITNDLSTPTAYGDNFTVNFSVVTSASNIRLRPTAPGFTIIGGIPTGTVEIRSSATVLCSYTLLTSDHGVGSCDVIAPPPGTYDLVAYYLGDSNFNTSNSGTPVQHVVNGDTTPPQTFIDTHPNHPTKFTTGSFTFHGTDNSGSVAGFTCQIDLAAPVACNAGTYTTPTLTQGSHTFTVSAVDASNNTDPVGASYTWTIDTTHPTIAYTPLPATASTAEVPLTVVVTDNVAVGGVTANLSINGGPLFGVNCPLDSGNNYVCVFPASPQGTAIAYFVGAGDTAGNLWALPGATTPHLYTVGAATIPPGHYTSVGLAAGSTFGGDVIVDNNLDLQGIVDTGASTLSLACGATVSGAGPSAYVIGNFQKAFCGPEDFSFPVGTASDGLRPTTAPLPAPPEFSPFVAHVTAASPGATLTVFVVDNFLGGSDLSLSASRFWYVTQTGTLTANISYTYLDQDVNGDEALYNVLKRENGVTSVVATGSVDGATNTASASGISSFSMWGAGVLGLGPTAAPVSVGGRVVTADGRGIANVVIAVSGDTSSQQHIVRTNAFGYYILDGLPTGHNYVVTATARHFTFSQPVRVITLTDTLTDLDFKADPQ